MNSIIEAHQTYLSFCPYVWRYDPFIRMHNHYTWIGLGRYRNLEAEKREDDNNAKMNKKRRAEQDYLHLDKKTRSEFYDRS